MQLRTANSHISSQQEMTHLARDRERWKHFRTMRDPIWIPIQTGLNKLSTSRSKAASTPSVFFASWKWAYKATPSFITTVYWTIWMFEKWNLASCDGFTPIWLADKNKLLCRPTALSVWHLQNHFRRVTRVSIGALFVCCINGTSLLSEKRENNHVRRRPYGYRDYYSFLNLYFWTLSKHRSER